MKSTNSILLALAYFNLLYSFKWKLTSRFFLKLGWFSSSITQSRAFVYVFVFIFDFTMYHRSFYCLFNVWGVIYINQHILKCVQLNYVTWNQILSFSLSLTGKWTVWKVALEICQSLAKKATIAEYKVILFIHIISATFIL